MRRAKCARLDQVGVCPQWRAFTISEMIVALAVITVLIGIAAPSLSRIRLRAEETSARGAMRQTALALLSYCTDNRQALPYLGTPGDPGAPLVANGVELLYAQGAYFGGQGRFWVSLVRSYLTGLPKVGGTLAIEPAGESFGVPASEADKVLNTRFWLTHTAFAAPAYWESEHTPSDLSLYRGTRLSDVQRPGRKGMLLDTAFGVFGLTNDDRKTRNDILVAMFDGSVKDAAFMPQADFVQRPHGAAPIPLMSTRGGLAGVDF